jgi:murein DD-endopeptidase MepM/ murein hydrolase activator NlpD
LITFIIGALVGAAILFVALQDVPETPAPAVTAAAPAAAGIPALQIDGQLPPAPVATGHRSAMPGKLLVPVQGIKSAQLTDTFYQPRGEQRQHEALDIMAPTGTPVIAVADGKVVKLFQSKPGGLTVYQFDPTEQFAYYYAHLDRYADGLAEGMDVKRGTVIGYVGVTGNSDPNAPHLHFALVSLTAEKQWWKGTPINPFPLMSDQ